VVDDEASIRDIVRGFLERDGMAVTEAVDGPSAVEAARASRPDIVVLDIMLPGFDGLEVLRQVRTFADPYVLMLTARSDEIDRIVGLSVGADDYLTKPFSPRELVARVRAILRRHREPASAIAPERIRRFGELGVDVAARIVTVGERQVELTAIEFDLLAALVRDPGVVVTRQQLLDAVWGVDFFGDRARRGELAARGRLLRRAGPGRQRRARRAGGLVQFHGRLTRGDGTAAPRADRRRRPRAAHADFDHRRLCRRARGRRLRSRLGGVAVAR
jgi:DNA-binding response OmpR family regulator